MPRAIWLDAKAFANLAEVTRQAAHYALTRCISGQPWRGTTLRVEERSGVRGHGGKRLEVDVYSLPEAIQDRWRAKQEVPLPLFALAAPAGSRLATGQWGRQSGLFDIIEPAVRPGLTDAERVEATKAIVAAGHAKSSVYRWIKAYHTEGLSGLARLEPSNKGQRRVVASKAFHDAYTAAGHSADLLAELDTFVDRSIKGLWKGRASTAGQTEVRDLAGFLLFEECERLGVPVARDACQISDHRVEQWRKPFEAVAKKNLHAKAFADSLPRISRDWTKLDPMAMVIADVKHLDVVVTRPDGSTSYPKLIGFMDGGTGRIFTYLVLCPQRHSITQELVIEAFLAMCRDPEWGMPRQLYLDNGSEFGGLDKIVPALELLRGEDGRAIVHAMPYNASAKPIEALFRRLDQYCFASMVGYTGPNRMDKRTQNVGRAPEAYSKSWECFCEEVGVLVAYYHQRVVGGQWNASPNEVFRAKLDTWAGPVFAAPLALEMSFCSPDKRLLRKDGVSFNGRRFHHPELLNVPIGTELALLVPWQKDQAPIVAMPGAPPFQLQLDLPYPANDTAGSIESASRKGQYLKNVAKLDREVPTIHPAEVKRRIVAKAAPVVLTGRTRILDQGEAVSDLAAIGKVIEHRPASDIDAAARRRAREDRLTQNLLRSQARART